MTAREGRRSPERPEEFLAYEVRAARHNRELVNELARWREERGMTQAEVAKRMQTSQSAVARLESHQHDAQLSTLARYITALGLAVTYSLLDRETGREVWRSGEQSGSGEVMPAQALEGENSQLEAERTSSEEAYGPPLPERDAVLQRVTMIVEALGTGDETASRVVDSLIQSWISAWISAIEAGYAERQASARMSHSQALHRLAQSIATAQHERRELDRLRQELELASQQAEDQPAKYRSRLDRDYREQANRVAAANAEAERDRLAVSRYDSELGSEDDSRLAAIADSHALGAEAAAYARVLMAGTLQDPVETGVNEADRMTGLPEAPEEETSNRSAVSPVTSERPATMPPSRSVTEAATETRVQSPISRELLSIWQDPRIRRLAAARAGGEEVAEEALQETFYQIASAQDRKHAEDLRPYFIRVLLHNIYRSIGLREARHSDLRGPAAADAAEDLQGRGSFRASEESRPAEEAALEHLLIDTWRSRLNSNRDQLKAAVPRRSPDPGRYREVIAAVAEAVLRSATVGDVSSGDSNAALKALYPEWFNEPGTSPDHSYQRFSRARSDVRVLLRTIISREELL
jgi:transcriptional regulator with XRE-family HTH domain